MRKCMFACAVATVASFLADQVSAQESLQAPATTTITATESAPQTQRSGLFSRLRNRRPTTTVSQPMTTTTLASTTTPAPTPSKVLQAQAVEIPMSATTPVVESRQGLLSRLRARR